MSGHVLRWPLFSLKIAPSHVGSLPPSNTWSLGPTQVHITNSISIGSAIFEQLTQSPYTLQWATLFPPKKLPLHTGIWIPI